MTTSKASRREFLKTASALSALGAASPFALNLASIGSAAAQAGGGYRALVCLFWFGGNDHTNTVIPYDVGSHRQYFDARRSIAIANDAALTADQAAVQSRNALTATSLGAVAAQGGREFALHPSLAFLRERYAAGNLAILANVGPLVVPTTKVQYQSRAVPLPPKLFSHNDQQSVWQANQPLGEGARIGWGGRIGDLLAAGNGIPIFTAVSAAGNTVWLSGDSVRQYQVSTTGAVNFTNLKNPTPYTGAAGSATTPYERLLQRTSSHLFENEIAAVNKRSIEANALLNTSLPAAATLTPAAPAANALAAQLNVVARMIAARGALAASRQVFFVSLGGFDNHDFLLNEQLARHNTVNEALALFWGWLGQLNVQNDVTLFTASDFGRTLTSNGDGSDHGWGAHHFILGGAVKGGTILGQFPPTVFGSSQDVGSGNLLPTTSVDQYAATLARWLGVAESDMALVLPNVGNFATRYLDLFL